MYEYLASVQSAVRRINERIQKLSDKFGSNSGIVNKIKTQIDVILPDNKRFKGDVIQISKPSDIYGDDEKMKALQALEKDTPKWGDYRKEYEDRYNRYASNTEFFKGDKVDIDTYIQTVENLQNAISNYDSESFPDEVLDILEIKGRQKTYDELKTVTDILVKKGYV